MHSNNIGLAGWTRQRSAIVTSFPPSLATRTACTCWGMVAFQRGDADQAVELIRRAIAIHCTAASYYSNLGNVLQSQEKMAEAEACYRRALDIRPDQAEVHLSLGHILKAQGAVDAALDSYRSARLLDPALAEAQVAESTALLLQRCSPVAPRGPWARRTLPKLEQQPAILRKGIHPLRNVPQ